MKPSVIPMSFEYAESFRECFDFVAKERKFLSSTEAPTIENIKSYVLRNLERGCPYFIAVVNANVVGWCVASASEREGFRHTGHLGIGILPPYRRQGLGKILLAGAIDAAFAGFLTRLEIEVFSSNLVAINMYQKFGFTIEGKKRDARIIDGITDDLFIMSLLKTDGTVG